MSDHDIIKGQRLSWLQLYIFFGKWTACHLKWWKWKSMSIISKLRPTEKQKDSAWPGRRQKSLVIQLMISDCILGGITVLTVQIFILFILPIHTLTRLLIVKTCSGQQNFINPVPLRRHYRVTKKWESIMLHGELELGSTTTASVGTTTHSLSSVGQPDGGWVR